MKRRKTKEKRPIAKSRTLVRTNGHVENPEIFIKLENDPTWRTRYARARVREKRGGYQYLTWRDGKHVRSFYLGRKREK